MARSNDPADEVKIYSRLIPRLLQQQKSLKLSDGELVLLLNFICESKDFSAKLSIARLAERTGKPERTVRRIRRKLLDRRDTDGEPLIKESHDEFRSVLLDLVRVWKVAFRKDNAAEH